MNVNLEPIKQEVDNFLYSNQEFEIISSEGYTKAGDILKIVKNKIESIEEQRMSWTRPLDESKKKIMADVKAIIDPLKEFEVKAKDAMIKWWKIEKRKKDAEQAEIDRKAIKKLKENKEIITEVAVVNDIKTIKGEVSTTTMKKVYKFDIIDESKVPREYLSVDEKKIKAAIRLRILKIDGVNIYQDEQISIR